MNFVLPVIMLALPTAVSALVWWLMTHRPAQWASLVEKENNFWRDRRWVSATLTEKMKRWEKGKSLKVLAAISTIIGAFGLGLTLSVLIKVSLIEHQKLRMPYNPILRQTQGHR